MSQVLLDVTVAGDPVTLLGDDYTGGLRVTVDGNSSGTLTRDDARLLTERLAAFLDRTADCPRCQHARLDHFALWTVAGKLYGCSHGTDERWPLAQGLPCDCPGIPQ